MNRQIVLVVIIPFLMHLQPVTCMNTIDVVKTVEVLREGACQEKHIKDILTNQLPEYLPNVSKGYRELTYKTAVGVFQDFFIPYKFIYAVDHRAF